MSEDDRELIIPFRPSVYKQVAAVLADLPAIGKNSQAPSNMGGYKFRGIEDITAALKPLLADHGIFMVPSVIERQEGTRQTRGGGVMYVVDILVRFTFYATDGSSFTAEVWGEGTDSGDKATQKAMTSAFKSMLSVTFCISDSENDAERHDVPETVSAKLASETDLAMIVRWFEALGDEHQPTVRSEVRERFGPSQDLLASQVDAVIDYIDKRGQEIRAQLPASLTGASPSPGGERNGAAGAPPDVRPPAAPSSDRPIIPEPPRISPQRLKKASARVVALSADKVPVAARREAAGLPPLDGRLSEAHMDGWEALLDVLEGELEAPFVEAS